MKTFDDHMENKVVAEHPLLKGYQQLPTFKAFVEKRARELLAYQESLTPDDLKDIFSTNVGGGPDTYALDLRSAVYAASRVLNETLTQFDLPLFPKVAYLNVRDAKYARDDNTNIVAGVVMFDIELVSLTGVRKHATVPVNVYGGQVVPPSVMEVDNRLYVVSQDAFDHIIGRITSYELPELRTMFEPPLDRDEREAAVGMLNDMGWQPRKNQGYLMQPTKSDRGSRKAKKVTPDGFDMVVKDLEAAEEAGDDTFPRQWNYVLRHYILEHVSTASKDAWMQHLVNKGFVINPYGQNRGRKSGSNELKQAQSFPEEIKDLGEPMEKEVDMEVSGPPTDMEEVIEAIIRNYPGTRTPIEPEDNVKFNKGQRGCIVEVDAENDFLIVKSQGQEYRVKVDEVEPLPGTFKKMYM